MGDGGEVWGGGMGGTWVELGNAEPALIASHSRELLF